MDKNEKEAARQIVFICAGNTCRSPMAEAIFKKLAASEGKSGHFDVSSAGIMAGEGSPANPSSLIAMLEIGEDISRHRARHISALNKTDGVAVTMTALQKDEAARLLPLFKVYSLGDFCGGDIGDPIGMGIETYRACRDRMAKGIRSLWLFLNNSESQREGEPDPLLIACDHAAFGLKLALIGRLKEMGVRTEDMGCRSAESVHYPRFAAAVASLISEGKRSRGVLLCGTGIGMSIAANKFPRVRAALCHDVFTARASREHNDANILVMGARTLTEEEAAEILKEWLITPFAGGRHQIRLDMIGDLESGLAGSAGGTKRG